MRPGPQWDALPCEWPEQQPFPRLRPRAWPAWWGLHTRVQRGLLLASRRRTVMCLTRRLALALWPCPSQLPRDVRTPTTYNLHCFALHWLLFTAFVQSLLLLVLHRLHSSFTFIYMTNVVISLLLLCFNVDPSCSLFLPYRCARCGFNKTCFNSGLSQWLKWGGGHGAQPLFRFELPAVNENMVFIIHVKKCSFMHKMCEIPPRRFRPLTPPPPWPGHLTTGLSVKLGDAKVFFSNFMDDILKCWLTPTDKLVTKKS